MKIEHTGDLTYYTYYMLDWSKTRQSPSEATCTNCGRQMMDVEPVRDNAGIEYDGRVCHNCKILIWVKRD